MKHVTKEQAPASFVAWRACGNEHWVPGYGDLQNPEKRELHEALIAEQGAVCCYCGRRIGLWDSHIEHFRPQEHWPALALDYQNLHASCLRDTEPGQPLHCGHAKGSSLDEACCISPLEDDCEQRFGYALDGHILGHDAKAAYMADLLKLDGPVLRNRRGAVLEGVFDNDFLASATAEELAAVRAGYVRRDESGRLPDLGHVVAHFAEQLLPISSGTLRPSRGSKQ